MGRRSLTAGMLPLRADLGDEEIGGYVAKMVVVSRIW
jgi:hypothetical protein